MRDLRLMRGMSDIARLEMLELFHALARIRHDLSGYRFGGLVIEAEDDQRNGDDEQKRHHQHADGHTLEALRRHGVRPPIAGEAKPRRSGLAAASALALAAFNAALCRNLRCQVLARVTDEAIWAGDIKALTRS